MPSTVMVSLLGSICAIACELRAAVELIGRPVSASVARTLAVPPISTTEPPFLVVMVFSVPTL
jgi:hypothetical protein